MAPRASKPSGFLKNCDIAVIGGLGKDAKTSEVEKWIVNNGGTYSSKIKKSTTHVVCTMDTYQKDNYALPKQYADRKRLYFVAWPWLEDSLHARRVKPAKQYLHSGNWDGHVDKKAARRRAMLTGKSDAVDAVQSEPSDQVCVTNVKATGNKGVENKTTHDNQDLKKPMIKKQPVFELSTFSDKTGLLWQVNLKGSELACPEDGDYVLSILVTNGEPPYYRAQYLHSAENLAPTKHTLSVGGVFDVVRTEFEVFYRNKTGKKWSEHCAEIQANARPEKQKSEQSEETFYDADSQVAASTES